MRPASPVVCEPADVCAPVIGCLPSRNIGSGALPDAKEVAVVVTDKELTAVPLLRLTACSKVLGGLGLENCTLVPSAALSCATTELIPPEKSTPITWLFAPVEEFAGRVPPCPSATTVTVCWLLLASV